jgi:hypothetical protein
MNFFKKALVATAVVASFGASAAKITPSTTILTISEEGIANAVAIPDGGFNLDVKVEANTAAASNLKIVFGAGVDLSTVSLAVGNAVTQTPGLSKSDDMEISFGTGSFTFDNFAVDTTTAGAHFVTFDVSLGQPMNVGAAFNVKFLAGKVGIAANATYTANDGASEIDSGVGAISKVATQFSFEVSTPLNALINRTNAQTFTPAGTVDTLVYKTTNASTLSRAITATGSTVEATGNFKDIVAAKAIGTVTTGLAPVTMSVADKTVLSTLDAAATTAATNAATVTFDSATGGLIDIPATGDVNVKYTIAGNFTAGTYVLHDKDDGGEWAVDATIINVPYFPVGYEGIQSTIQLANEGSSLVDVIVTANDKNGVQYGPYNLNMIAGFEDGLPKMAVSKVSDTALMDLLKAPAGSSLSVTFNIDANEGVVNGYAYTQKPGTGRSEISTSQQRGN